MLALISGVMPCMRAESVLDFAPGPLLNRPRPLLHCRTPVGGDKTAVESADDPAGTEPLKSELQLIIIGVTECFHCRPFFCGVTCVLALNYTTLERPP